MSNPRPATLQKSIDFDRSTRLKLRAAVKLPPAEKFILWIIDDHIGSGRSWTMTYGQLAEESGYTERCVRKMVDALEERLIVWTERASNHYHDSRRAYFISWPNLAELVEEQAAPTDGPTESPPVDREHGSGIVNVVPESGTWFTNRERSSGIVNHVHDSTYTKTAPITAPTTAPSPPSSSEPERLAVMMVLRKCGVGKAQETLATAESNGMTMTQVTDVVAHFLARPGRWEIGVLVRRLTVQDAESIGPHEGWDGFRTKPGYRPPAAQAKPSPRPALDAQFLADLESSHGAILDAMSPAELDDLAADWTPRERQGLNTRGKNSPDLRRRLLVATRQREQNALDEAHGPTLDAMSRGEQLQLAASHPDPASAERIATTIRNGFGAAVRPELLQLLADGVLIPAKSNPQGSPAGLEVLV